MTPPKLSSVIQGLWNIHLWSSESIQSGIQQRIDAGITSFDLADIYGNYSCEEVFGRFLKSNPQIRSKIEIISKCGIVLDSDHKRGSHQYHYDTSREHVIASAERSLELLGTDYLDVYLIHRPDPLVNFGELKEAIEELFSKGMIRSFGVSNFSPSQISSLQDSGISVTSHQFELNYTNVTALFDGTLDQCQSHGIAPMLWSPFASGKLFHDTAVLEKMGALAEKYQVSCMDLVMGWFAKIPVKVHPVLGSEKFDRIESCARSFDKVKLEREDWFQLLQIFQGQRLP